MKLILLIGSLGLTLVLGNKYSREELKALEEFSSLVKSDLPHEYMKENDYLINWIRSASVPQRNQNGTQEFDLKKAKENLVANLAWRKQNDIDNVLNEDFSEMYKVYPPLGKPIIDKDGGTVFKFALADLDVTKLTKEMIDRFTFFGYAILERTARGTMDNKSPHTTWIIDARHYNPDLHFGEAGKTSYTLIFGAIEEHYPAMMKRLIYINAPASFSEMGEVVNSSLSLKLRKEFRVFGENEAEWAAYLEKFMDKDQIPILFFGKKYTQEEMKALTEFFTLVKSELPQEYMKKDDYLIKWIRSDGVKRIQGGGVENFDLNKAKEKLDANLAWRIQNNMDNILKEDFTSMYKVYPAINPPTVDKDGGTVFTFDARKLDLTNLKMTAETERTSRYFNYMLEKMSKITTEYRSPHASWVIDVRSYNLDRHFNQGAKSVYSILFESIEAHYPSFLKRITYVNAPETISELKGLVESCLSPEIKNEFKVFGQNETEWSAYLNKITYHEQIPKAFFDKPK